MPLMTICKEHNLSITFKVRGQDDSANALKSPIYVVGCWLNNHTEGHTLKQSVNHVLDLKQIFLIEILKFSMNLCCNTLDLIPHCKVKILSDYIPSWVVQALSSCFLVHP